MKFGPDILTKYLTVGLIVIVIAALFLIVILPATETRSVCTGFQYVVFLNQKMAQDQYSVELLNGVGDITVNKATLNGVDLGITVMDVSSGERVILTSTKDPTDKKADETFSHELLIFYDVKDGIKDNKDTATCTGKVQ